MKKKSLVCKGKGQKSPKRYRENEVWRIPLSFAQTRVKKITAFCSLMKARAGVFGKWSEIKEAEGELGRLYYESYSGGSPIDREKEKLLRSRISAAKQGILTMRDRISDLHAKAAGDADFAPDGLTEEDCMVLRDE